MILANLTRAIRQSDGFKNMISDNIGRTVSFIDRSHMPLKLRLDAFEAALIEALDR